MVAFLLEQSDMVHTWRFVGGGGRELFRVSSGTLPPNFLPDAPFPWVLEVRKKGSDSASFLSVSGRI